MKKILKKLLRKSVWAIDIAMSPFVFAAAITMKTLRRGGIARFPLSKRVLLSVGIYPIVDHYYEPLFNPRRLRKPLSDERPLPGIANWNVEEQLSLLKSFNFQQELENIPENFVDEATFYFKNGAYGSGDSEYWYSIIRLKKPARIIEIGSGESTKMAQLAIRANQKDDRGYQCRHICIEPYEMPWLEKTGVEVLRKKAEDVGVDFFEQLEANDILFIDSSHMIRPQGDVLFEYLELLPTLKRGVIVHIHDIFSPRDYPDCWVVSEIRLWNEQYLLEAFLSFNPAWKILGTL
ncbi:MAG: class I SAM-dependent methyltransferase, partial [Prevotellaceae bacterium]|nr:class I SAM-dependent methyltransferase [Prevotellaceae bacterium]